MKPTNIFQVPTVELQKSIEFYSKLGFNPLNDQGNYVADGSLVIEINTERKARTSLKIYSDIRDELFDSISSIAPFVEMNDSFIVSDPSGVLVELHEPSDVIPVPEVLKPSLLGNFSGISIETIDFKASVQFWEKLGFTMVSGDLDQGWGSFSNGSSIDVSVMKAFCPHLFFNPGLTYFNSGKNLEVIAKIRALEIPITEEITCFNDTGLVDNVIIQDPGGTGFYIFND